ncbi:MAG: V-type ATP synthase subunit F [bacterium]
MDTEKGRVAVVGRGEVVTPFRAVGLDVYSIEMESDPVSLVESLIHGGYQLIFFTDDLADSLQPLVEKYHNAALPCLVALPFTGTDAGEEGLRAAVRRACGADLFSAGRERVV